VRTLGDIEHGVRKASPAPPSGKQAVLGPGSIGTILAGEEPIENWSNCAGATPTPAQGYARRPTPTAYPMHRGVVARAPTAHLARDRRNGTSGRIADFRSHVRADTVGSCRWSIGENAVRQGALLRVRE
jgi:hypothetical protein